MTKKERRRALKKETSGKVRGFRVFVDGTVQREALGKVMEAWPRSQVIDVEFVDNRQRKSVAGRSLAAGATLGLSLLASNQAGHASLHIVTKDWVETVTASSPSEVDDLARLQGLLIRAKISEPAVKPQSQAGAAVQPDRLAAVAALRDLKQLHDEAILSDEEYESRRKRLIDLL